MDAVGIVLRELEPVKAAAWAWFKKWKDDGRKAMKTTPNKGLELVDLIYSLPWASQPRLV